MSDESFPQFGRWQAVAILGRGAQGVAYKAQLLGRPHHESVVKWFIGDFPIERFSREVDALSRVENKNGLPTILGQGVRDGHPWVAMKYAAGDTLARHTLGRGPLTPTDWLPIAIRLMGALRDVHAVGVVHRDIKPANILIDDRGLTTLIDFGLAVVNDHHSQTQNGQFLGTFAYIAPEGLQDALDLSPKSDVFSLAASLTFVACGKTPPDVLRLGPLGNQAWMGAAQELTPDWRRDILMRCLSEEPAERPTSSDVFEILVAQAPDAIEGIDGSTAINIADAISDFALNRTHLESVRVWLELSQRLEPERLADRLARLVEHLDGTVAALPYWERFAEQRPITGNVWLFRRLRSSPEISPENQQAASALLYRAAELGGFETGSDLLAEAFIEIGDYEAALRCLHGEHAPFPDLALCHHRLGLPAPQERGRKTHPMIWLGAARRFERRGLHEDAEWFRSMAGTR